MWDECIEHPTLNFLFDFIFQNFSPTPIPNEVKNLKSITISKLEHGQRPETVTKSKDDYEIKSMIIAHSQLAGFEKSLK